MADTPCSITELVVLVDVFDGAQPRKRPGRKPKLAAPK